MARLDETLERQVQRTGSNTGRLRSDAERSAFSTNVRADLAVIMRQWNEVAYPLFNVLSSTDTLNALELGLSGNVLFSHIQATEASAPIFWDTSLSRQRTVRESFDYTVSELSRLENLIAGDVDVDAYDDTQVVADIAQLDANLTQLRKDTMGPNYTLDNDGNPNLTYSLSQAIDAIGAKFSGFPGTGNTYTSTYPALSFTVLLSEVVYDVTIPQAGITNLTAHLQAIRDFIGKDLSGAETPTYSAYGSITHVSDGLNLEEAIQVLDQTIPPLIWNDALANIVSNNGPESDVANDSFVFGSTQLDDTGAASNDARFFFDKAKGAFRAGTATGTEWNTRGSNSVAFGLNNQALGTQAAILGGSANTITSGALNATIAGGGTNTINDNGDRGFIGAGLSNTVNASYSTVVAGETNQVLGTHSFIGAGFTNYIESTSTHNFIGTGTTNTIGHISGTHSHNAIVAGTGNYIEADSSFIGAGSGNQIIDLASNLKSAIGAGTSNRIDGASNSFIGAGASCVIEASSGSTCFIGAANSAWINGPTNVSSAIVTGFNVQIEADASYSTILSANTANVWMPYGVILNGDDVSTIHTNEVVFGHYKSGSTNFNSQRSILSWHGTEGGDTAFHILHVEGSFVGSENIVLPDNCSYHFSILVAGRIDATTTSALYRVTGVAHRGTGVASTVITHKTVNTLHESNANWDVDVVESVSEGSMLLMVKGDTGETPLWTAAGEIIKIYDTV